MQEVFLYYFDSPPRDTAAAYELAKIALGESLPAGTKFMTLQVNHDGNHHYIQYSIIPSTSPLYAYIPAGSV